MLKWPRSKLLPCLLLSYGLCVSAQERKADTGFQPNNLKGVDSSTRRELSDEEISQQFFNKSRAGQKTAEPTLVFLPVFYEQMEKALGRVPGRVTSELGQAMTVELDQKVLYSVFDELIIESYLRKYKKDRPPICSKPQCFIDLKVFKDTQFTVEFSEANLELRILVPPELRNPRTSSLLRINGYTQEATDAPSLFSTFINVNLNQQIVSSGTSYKGGRQPLLGQFDSGTRFGRLVIDATGQYLEKREETPGQIPEFRRGDVRGIVDFPSQRIRVQAGDLSYPVAGFQTFLPIMGGAVFTRFSLEPSRLTLPGGDYELFLALPSRVSVFINNQLVQVLNLPAGRHNLRDFPFNGGLNDLRLEITDESGRVEIKNYTFFSNSELLKPGLHDLSYAAGNAAQDRRGVRTYDAKSNSISLYHRVGLTQRFTAGLNFQSEYERKLMGLEGLLSTAIGYFSLEPAYSSGLGQSGYATSLRYIFQNYVTKARRNRFWALEAKYYSENFGNLSSTQSLNPIEVQIQATHTRTISDKTSLNFGISRQINRQLPSMIFNRETSGASLGISNRWADGLTTSLNIRHSQSANGGEDFSITAFLVWSMTKEKQYVTASHDSGAKSSRADFTYQPSAGVGGFTAQANVFDKENASGYGGTLDYIGNRARLNATQDVAVLKATAATVNPNPLRRSVNTTNFRLGTAFVFAGGHFGVSRPVTDAFAIIAPLENLRGQNIEINAQGDEYYLARTDWLGSAVLPEMASYAPNDIKINTKKLTRAAALPRDTFLIKPPYHSGYAIEIGSDAIVYLKTQLIRDDGSPIALVAGQAIYLTDPSKDSITVFTNRSGLLRSEGFRAGRYRLEIREGGQFAPVEFEIPEGKIEVELPPIKLKPGGP